MINSGINRSAVTVPGSLVCQPGPPQTGWWWNPLEDGRGFSLEVRGNNLFFAAFLYDISGRSTWYVSTGPVSLDGSYYAGDLLSARGGQTLGGAYPGFPTPHQRRPDHAHLQQRHPGHAGVAGRHGADPALQHRAQRAEPAAGARASPRAAGGGTSRRPGAASSWSGRAATSTSPATCTTTRATRCGTSPRDDRRHGDSRAPSRGNWWSFGNGQTLTGAWKPNVRRRTMWRR